jgi:hypothetical protein
MVRKPRDERPVPEHAAELEDGGRGIQENGVQPGSVARASRSSRGLSGFSSGLRTTFTGSVAISGDRAPGDLAGTDRRPGRRRMPPRAARPAGTKPSGSRPGLSPSSDLVGRHSGRQHRRELVQPEAHLHGRIVRQRAVQPLDVLRVRAVEHATHSTSASTGSSSPRIRPALPQFAECRNQPATGKFASWDGYLLNVPQQPHHVGSIVARVALSPFASGRPAGLRRAHEDEAAELPGERDARDDSQAEEPQGEPRTGDRGRRSRATRSSRRQAARRRSRPRSGRPRTSPGIPRCPPGRWSGWGRA